MSNQRSQILTALVVSTIVGVISYFWVPFAKWQSSLSDALLVVDGLIIAALLQFIPMTTSFLQADDLTVAEVDAISVKLLNQQSYWLGMLLVCITLAGSLVVAKIYSHPNVVHWVFSWRVLFHIEQSIGFIIAFLFSLIMLRLFYLIRGVRELQQLKSGMVHNIAVRKQQGRIKQSKLRKLTFSPKDPSMGLSPGFGKIVDPSRRGAGEGNSSGDT